MRGLTRFSQVIVAVSVVLASVACAQEQGVTVTLSGQETVFAQATPVVRIEFDYSTIYVSCPISKSPDFQMDASASPPGGSFKWEITTGKDKVEFLSAAEGDLADHVKIRGTAPSDPAEMYGDVGIKVTYTINSQIAEDTKYISVVKPSSLSVIKIEGPMPYEDGYEMDYYFQVMDQKGNALTHSMYWEEKRKKISCSDKKLWDIIKHWTWLKSRSGPINWDGTFIDKLAIRISLPADFFLQVEQENTVAGCDVGTRYQWYYSTRAESVPVP